MTDDELTQIEKRATSATPGPWEVSRRDDIGGGFDYFIEAGPMAVAVTSEDTRPPRAVLGARSDAAFIAHAREDVPRLVADIRAARAAMRADDRSRAVRAVLKSHGCDCDCEHLKHGSEHEPDCERCLACSVEEAMGPPTPSTRHASRQRRRDATHQPREAPAGMRARELHPRRETMIRFVDLTPFYWVDEHPSNKPICAFIDTVTDRFIENDMGCHDFDSAEDVEALGPVLGPRCAGLVPHGFWERVKR